MRADIETEIDKVVLGCGFRRVRLNDKAEEQGDDLRTAWNRTLQLYERVECDTDQRLSRAPKTNIQTSTI